MSAIQSAEDGQRILLSQLFCSNRACRGVLRRIGTNDDPRDILLKTAVKTVLRPSNDHPNVDDAKTVIAFDWNEPYLESDEISKQAVSDARRALTATDEPTKAAGYAAFHYIVPTLNRKSDLESSEYIRQVLNNIVMYSSGSDT